MNHCTSCGAKKMKQAKVAHSFKVGEHTFFTKGMRVFQCENCGANYFPIATLMRMDLLAARELVQAGEISGEVLRFIRKAAGIKAVDLAALLDMTPEHVSRMETGKKTVDRRVMVILGSLVLDALEGRTSTMDTLKAQQKPKKLGKRVTLNEIEILKGAA